MELRIDQECLMWKKRKVVCHRRIGDRRLEGCVELIGGEIEIFEALKDTKFLLPQSEIIERSKVKRFAASSIELFNSCGLGRLLKKKEECRAQPVIQKDARIIFFI